MSSASTVKIPAPPSAASPGASSVNSSVRSEISWTMPANIINSSFWPAGWRSTRNAEAAGFMVRSAVHLIDRLSLATVMVPVTGEDGEEKMEILASHSEDPLLKAQFDAVGEIALGKGKSPYFPLSQRQRSHHRRTPSQASVHLRSDLPEAPETGPHRADVAPLPLRGAPFRVPIPAR